MAQVIALNFLHCFLARDVIHLALMLRCQCPSVCPSVYDGSALAHYSKFRFQIPIQIYCARPHSQCMRARTATHRACGRIVVLHAGKRGEVILHYASHC